jgi:hypothetical protein
VHYKNGTGCKRSGECPNEAAGSSYTYIAVIEQNKQGEQDEEDEMEE